MGWSVTKLLLTFQCLASGALLLALGANFANATEFDFALGGCPELLDPLPESARAAVNTWGRLNQEEPRSEQVRLFLPEYEAVFQRMHTELAKLRIQLKEHSPRIQNWHRYEDFLGTLDARLKAALRASQLRYIDYLELGLRFVAAANLAEDTQQAARQQNGMIKVSPALDEHLYHLPEGLPYHHYAVPNYHALKQLEFYAPKYIFFFTFSDLSLQDLVRLGPLPIFPIGLTLKSTTADGASFPPVDFFFHDVNHGVTSIQNDPIRGTAWKTLQKNILSRVDTLRAFYRHLADPSKHPNMRQAQLVVLFFILHETQDAFSRPSIALRFSTADDRKYWANIIFQRANDRRDLGVEFKSPPTEALIMQAVESIASISRQ